MARHSQSRCQCYDGRTVTSKTGQHSFTIKAPVFSPELDANIDKSRFAREGSGAAYEEALQQAKYDAINGYYTLIMYRNKVDVATKLLRITKVMWIM